jgi:hypothetical protein
MVITELQNREEVNLNLTGKFFFMLRKFYFIIPLSLYTPHLKNFQSFIVPSRQQKFSAKSGLK